VTKLTRYLVLLAGFALAMLMSVPAASASEEEVGPHTHACKVATDKADKVVEKIKDFLWKLKEHETKLPTHRVAAVAPVPVPTEWVKKDWDKKEWTEEQLLEVLYFISKHEKVPDLVKKVAYELKDALHKAREDRWHACKPPAQHEDSPAEHHEESPAEHENAPAADNADFSQVNDVPVGPVDTGGGPA